MVSLLWLVILWSLNDKGFGLDLDKARVHADAISRELHATLEENTGKQQLEKAYELTSCSTVAKEKPEVFLSGIVLSIERRFNDAQSALLNSKATVFSQGVQNDSLETAKVSLEDCCNLSRTRNLYNARFRTEVNTSVACESIHVSRPYNGTIKDDLLDTFIKNLKVSSSVSWQYFGSAQGHYIQYPSNPRVCNSSNLFDPRFKSWYVNAVSRAHINVLLIIDRSLSMMINERMNLARLAGLTVLDTLGADDNIGVLAFSNNIYTPSGCFGDVIAQATPSNIHQLKTWVRKLQPMGGTKYVPPFTQAFKMLARLQNNEISNATSVILFLTDGEPYDYDNDIFNAIRQGQKLTQNRTIINTYGLGSSLNYHGVRRLQKIANQNSGRFTHISDADASGLRSIMGQYYSQIPGTVRDLPVISLPYLDKDHGLVTTMSAARLGPRNDVIGVVAQDVVIDELLKEVVQFSASDGLSYVAVVDFKGRTIIHPSVPKPSDHLAEPVFQSLSLYEPSLKEDMLRKITSGVPGSAVMTAFMSSSRGDPRTDGVQTVVVNATFTWRPVGSSPYIVILVTAQDQIETFEQHELVAQRPQSKSFYHRLDLTMNKIDLSTTPVCNMNGYLVSRQFSTVKLAPEAFNDSSQYIAKLETLQGVFALERFFNKKSPGTTYPGLSESVRVEVMLTLLLEKTWNESEHMNPRMLEWRFVATNGGVFRVFPGIRLQKTYSHLRQPWYMRAVSNAGRLTISRATTNKSGFQSPGSLLSLVTTFNAPRCTKGIPPSSKVAGVIGVQLSHSAFSKIFTRIPALCDRLQHDCYIIDNSGYIVSDILNLNTVTSRHVTQVFPWLAASLASQGNFVKQFWCNNLEKHEVQLFYRLVLPRDLISSPNGTRPCRQYVLVALPNTNAYLLVFRSRVMYGCNEIGVPECNQCEAKCSNCTGYVSSCQCPCSCSMKYDECTNSVTGLWTGIPCPASVPKSRDISVGTKSNSDALLKVPICPIPCDSLSNKVDCNASSTCHWCHLSSLPVCSEICRIDTRIDVFIRFPCNDFTKLSKSQKGELRKSFIKMLIKVADPLTTAALDVPVSNMTGIAIAIHGTTDGIPVLRFREKITAAVEGKLFSIGPTENIKRVYTAESPKSYTNLQVQLYVSPWPETSLTEDQIQQTKHNLQNTLYSLLGESLASRARDFKLTKGIISFNLSNEGQVSRYSIKDIERNLTAAVQSNTFSIQIINEQVYPRGISTTGSFDYFCSPTDSTTTPSSVTPSVDSLLTLPPLTKNTTLPPLTKNTTLPPLTRNITLLPITELFQPNEKNGLIPTEIFIVIFTALGLASCCGPLVMFFAFRKRKKTVVSRLTASPETEIEEDTSPEGSQLTDEEFPSPQSCISPSFVNPYFTRRSTIDSMKMAPQWSGVGHENSLIPVGSVDDSTDPPRPRLSEHRASIVVQKQKSVELGNRERFEMSESVKRKIKWKESVRKLNEKKRQEMAESLGVSSLRAHTRKVDNSSDIGLTTTNKTQEKTQFLENTINSSNSSNKTTSKQGFIDCDVDTIVAEGNSISRPVKTRKYHRSQSNKDISMATFRILDNTNRRQSFQVLSESNRRSLLGKGVGVSTLKEQATRDFHTRTELGGITPIQAWSKTKDLV